MTAQPLADAAARERIRTALDETLVVEAAAGTGKTTELVARIVALVSSGKARLRNLIAVTFTERAAGEMKLRLRGEIEKARQAALPSSDAHGFLVEAIKELETAHVGTIHALCADLLRERPVEARVDPYFEVAAGDEADALFDDAFDTWFDTHLHSPPEGIRRLLRRPPAGWKAPGPRDQLRRAAGDLSEHRDFQTPWHRPPFDRDGRLGPLVEKLEQIGAYAARAQDPEDWLGKGLAEIADWARELRRREALHGRDYDGLEAELRKLSKGRRWEWTGRGRYAKGLERSTVLRERDAVKAELDAFVTESEMDLAALLQQDLQPVVQAYEELKARAGRLDFLDLLLRLRDLVRDDRAVRVELQQRFTHILVDEFQDTDPLQAELLLLLAADRPEANDWLSCTPKPGKLFVVGDPKQSIYRFRRADVTLYEAVKGRLTSAGAQVVYLTSSFRGDPALQQAVNAAFEHAMKSGPDSMQAQYVHLDPVRAAVVSRPAVMALPVPEPYGKWGKITNKAIEESLPDAVGAFIEWLVFKSGWTVSERGRDNVPVRPGHICLLFKRFVSFGSDMTRPYVTALEARRVPHVLVGGRSWHSREEVASLRTALEAIEWPDDELSVFATLRGSFFALSDEALLAFRAALGTLHPLRPLEDEQAKLTDLTRPVADALGVLAKLHATRNRRPAADTVSALLDETRAHAGLANRQSGEQALANVLQLVQVARRFEAPGATSFRAFVRRLARDAEQSDTGEAPFVEDGAEGVRLMTAHKAKGLEFPVVILCDPTAPAAQQNPTRWVDPAQRVWAMPLAGCVPFELESRRDEVLRRDHEEAVRLVYVAATRARDLLVVPTVGKEKIDGWLDPLEPALYPIDASRQNPQPAPGCPAFGTSTLVSGEDDSLIAFSVRPGLHAPQEGQHRVTWWDPHVLNLKVTIDAGLRHQKLLESDGVAGTAQQAAWMDWRAKRELTMASASKPSLRLETATNLATILAKSVGGDASVRHEAIASVKPDRPHGTRFGLLVHAVLAEVPLDGATPVVERTARVHARMLGCSEEEMTAAVDAVVQALQHPLLRAAAQSHDVRREAPLLVREASGEVVEAVVDLAWRDEAGWMVLDFKTDDADTVRRAQYEHQVRLYAEGIAAATGLRATPVLLSL